MPLIHLSRLARRPTQQPRHFSVYSRSLLRSPQTPKNSQSLLLQSPHHHHHHHLLQKQHQKTPSHQSLRSFSSTPPKKATFNQVLRGARKPRKQKPGRSPILSAESRPEIQGVCLRVGITKPKKPNSGERKTCRVRLSNGREVNGYIPGEGHNVQQHSVVLLRGGRAQDCPGVKYRLVRGAADLGGVPNRLTSRSKYGTKKPKKADPPA